MNSASAPSARSSLTSAWPSAARRPETTSWAPWLGEGEGGGAADAGERAGDENGLGHDTLLSREISGVSMLRR
jgi:hypothetical protein